MQNLKFTHLQVTHTQSQFLNLEEIKGFHWWQEALCSQSSGFRGFLLCVQESSPSLHILGMRNGVPVGTLVTWPVPDKLLPPFREHCCWLATAPTSHQAPPEVEHTGAQPRVPILAVPSGYTAAGRTVCCAHRARLQQRLNTRYVLFFSRLT